MLFPNLLQKYLRKLHELLRAYAADLRELVSCARAVARHLEQALVAEDNVGRDVAFVRKGSSQSSETFEEFSIGFVRE